MKPTPFRMALACCSLLLTAVASAATIGPDPTTTSVNVDGTFAVAT